MTQKNNAADQLVLDVMRYYRDVGQSGQRYGQAFMNYISATYPEVAEQIVGTHYDPYYRHYVDMETWRKVFELLDLKQRVE